MSRSTVGSPPPSGDALTPPAVPAGIRRRPLRENGVRKKRGREKEGSKKKTPGCTQNHDQLHRLAGPPNHCRIIHRRFAFGEFSVSLDSPTIRRVRFQFPDVEMWLPQSAEVYYDWRGKRIHRRHSFSHYLLFVVDEKQHIAEPKL